MSGLELRFQTTRKDYDATASLDRIDSSKGYIKGNVQWVHKNINYMKQEMTNEEFLVNFITAAKREIEHQIEWITNMPESVTIAGLDDGKIIGYSRSLELIDIALSLYRIRTEDGTHENQID